MSKCIPAAIYLFLYATVSWADALDINLNDKAARLLYNQSYGTAEISYGLLYAKEQDSDPVWLAQLGLEVAGEEDFGNSLWEGRVGAMLYGISMGNDVDGAALGLGGQLRIFPNYSRFGFGAHGYYAPQVVAGLDVDQFWEVGVRADFRMLDTARVYLGYRQIKTRLEESRRTITLDDGLHLGIDIRF